MPSKSILFIVPYPLGVAPSQRFRFEQYFTILREKGYTYHVASFWSRRAWDALYEKKNFILKTFAVLHGFLQRLLLIFQVSKFDYVFIHREALPLGPPMLEFVLTRIFNKKVVYDFDDAIWLPNTSSQNKIASIFKYHQKVKWICKWSWKISCGNGFLADYALKYNKNVMVNPTTIDLDYHVPGINQVSKTPLVVGWTGTHSTTKYLNEIAPVLSDLLKEYPIKILIISDQKPDWDVANYEFIKWNKDQEIEQLNRIDVGIMPLKDTIWEKGKCGFKALQYMALEIPAVVSDVGVNKEIIEHGVDGYLCVNHEDWKKDLVELITSEKKRKTMGVMGRTKVKATYSVQSNASIFLSLFA